MTDPVVIALCVASSAVTTAWHNVAGRLERERERRASCPHSWGDATEVCPPGAYGSRQRFYKRFCERGCGAQRDVNADGTPYVPRGRRK